MRIERVYVAGPYTEDPIGCTAEAIAVGNTLLDLGFAPFIPHLAHYWDRLHTSRGYEDWMRLDLAWVTAAHAVYRMPGKSSGADREVKLARSLSIPVVYSVAELQEACY